MIVAGFLLGLALVATLGLETGLGIGIPLLLVPGVIVSLMFIFSGFLVIDRGLGPKSHRFTRGYKWSLFGLSLLVLLITLAGLLAFIVGIFVSAPVALLALTHAYRVCPARRERVRRMRRSLFDAAARRQTQEN